GALESHLSRGLRHPDLLADLREGQAAQELEHDDLALAAREISERLADGTRHERAVVGRAPELRRVRGEDLAPAAARLVDEPAARDRVQPREHGRLLLPGLAEALRGGGEDVLRQVLREMRITHAAAQVAVDLAVV